MSSDAVEYITARDQSLAEDEPEAMLPEPRRLEREAGSLRAAGFFLLAAFCFTSTWLYPQQWGAYGVMGLIIVTSLIISCCIFMFRFGQLLVDEPLSEVVHALLGQPLALRTRGRFLNRLDHACEDARIRSRTGTFSLVIVRAESSGNADRGDRIALEDAIRSVVRGRDVIGELEGDDIAILALGAGVDAAEALCARVRANVREKLGAEVGVAWANFDTDAIDGKELIALARWRLDGSPAQDEQAAA